MEQLKAGGANSSPLTPISFLERAATVYGDYTSIVYDHDNITYTYTWSQTLSRCLHVASSLSQLGMGGQVVSAVAPNVPAMYELQFAVPMAGAILNNINNRLDAHNISVILAHSDSKLVFVDRQSSSLVLEAVALLPPDTPHPRLVVITDEDPHCKKQNNNDYYCTYEDMVDEGDSGFEWVRPRSEWNPMVLNYTSGTTSSPKGVVHCHRGTFIKTVDSLIDWSVPKQPVYLWTLPIFHANGWSFSWGIAAVGGINICLRKFDVDTIYASIKNHGVTHMCGAPTVLNMLSNSPNREPLSKPVQVLTAGAPPPSTVLSRAESLGFIVSHGYGLTETAGLVVSCAWKPEWNKLPASERAILKARQGVGTACMPDMDVVHFDTRKSVERDGSTLGEVVLKGGSIMLGYFKDIKGTKSCMSEDDGWLKTGDVGVMHADGYLEIKDRSKDVIISGGENISSVEVESVLYTHPAVQEAAVVAKPDAIWGETPCAFIILKTKTSEKDIREYCKSKLPLYMVPRKVVFIKALPKTSTGKIQKFLLRKDLIASQTTDKLASQRFRAMSGSKLNVPKRLVLKCEYPPQFTFTTTNPISGFSAAKKREKQLGGILNASSLSIKLL